MHVFTKFAEQTKRRTINTTDAIICTKFNLQTLIASVDINVLLSSQVAIIVTDELNTIYDILYFNVDGTATTENIIHDHF